MRNTNVLLAVFCLVVAVGLAWQEASAADEPGDDAVGMIVNLVADKDKDVRAVGLQQVREEAKGPAATKRFVELLPQLPPDSRAALIDALADRGDPAARPAVVEMLASREEQVRIAAIRALGALGQAADVPQLIQALAEPAGPLKTAAIASLVRVRGSAAVGAIVAELERAPTALRIELIGVVASRRAPEGLPALLAAAQDAQAQVRMAAMAALGQVAGPGQVVDMLQGVLKANSGPEREAAEKAVMFVCKRLKEVDPKAEPLLAAFAKLSAQEQMALLPALGRVGGPGALKIVESAMSDTDAARREAGFHALCLWPDASISNRLLDLAQNAGDAGHRAEALRALIRVAPLPDKRSEAERLALLKKALGLATRDDDRLTVVKRARAIRSVECLHFVLPYLDDPVFAQEACATIVELAHHKNLREPNKAEFYPALDRVIRISKDPNVIDKAKRYRQNKV
ncbi:MAG: HEAT repeat domain-containing protein [Thermoguttaceae bacterium]|jgi:HEAT repeat protein